MFKINILLSLLVLSFSAQAKYDCPSDVNVQDKILENLHFEVFVHLYNADNYLRAMINCMQDNPQKRSAQQEPMYTEFTTCTEIRDKLMVDLPKEYAVMRLNLSFARPRFREIDETVEQNGSLGPQYRFNLTPEHLFKGLSPLPPLSAAEIATAETIWKLNTKAFKLGYARQSAYGATLDQYQNLNDVTIDAMDDHDNHEELKYVSSQRAKARGKYLEAYYQSLTNDPLLGYLPQAPSVDNRQQVVDGLYTLLQNNCVVRSNMFTESWRRTINNQCENYIARLKQADRNGESLEQQDAISLQLAQQLNWKQPLKHYVHSLGMQDYGDALAVFGLHKTFIEKYRARFKDDTAYVCQLDRLEGEYEAHELIQGGLEIAFYLGMGAACTFGFKKVPGLTTLLARLGAPLCTFGLGLPLNAMFWFEGNDAYLDRFNEMVSHAPYQEAFQEFQAVESAQTAAALNTLFLAVGTGLPELTKAARPFVRLMRMKKGLGL